MSESASEAKAQRGRVSRLLRTWFAIALWKRILVALVLGIGVGLLWGEGAADIKWIGDIFIRLIRMLVTPLIFLIIASGVASLGDPKRLGSIGAKTLGFYFCTTGSAAILGLTLGALFQPGLGLTFADVVPNVLTMPKPAKDLFLDIIPLNPIKALAEGETLAVIFFAVFVGSGIIATGKVADPLRATLHAGSEVMLRLVGFVMEVAPFGVFALVAVVMGTTGLVAFVSVFWLAVCVFVGVLIQILIVHTSIIRLIAWLPIGPFFRGAADAMIIAFSTASSAATLPVALRVAENNLGISKPVASTVLPLGATLGMDGGALFLGILTMFAAQAFGLTLGLGDYVLLSALITIVIMGAGPVPSGSLFVLAVVLAAIGISPEQTALLLGFVLPFDRLLDMARTVANVTADLAVATTIAKWENELDSGVYHRRDDE